ncbi:MAG TPA: hypothetical protein VNP92_01465, partial [Actinophytocola sp.]|nr:hypothetical protein [Actinophytocola sp.]
FVGPILAAGIVVLAAFRYQGRHGRSDRRYGGPVGIAVAVGVLASIFLVVLPSESTPVGSPLCFSRWLGFLLLGAATVLATRGGAAQRLPVA